MDPHASWIVHVRIGWVTDFLVSTPSHGFRHKLINMLWKGQKDFPQAANEIGEDEQAFAVFLLQNLIHMRPVPSVQKSFEHVKSNFARYGLLDDQVVLLLSLITEHQSMPIEASCEDGIQPSSACRDHVRLWTYSCQEYAHGLAH